MSTSALASARRRRATNENPVAPTPSTSINNRTVQQVQKDIPREQNQTLTPLQILQIHDIKIKELETLITDFTDEDLLTKFIDDKLESVGYSKNVDTKNYDTKNDQSKNDESKNESTGSNVPSLALYDEKLQMQEKRAEQKMDDFKTSVRELIASIKEENGNIMKYVNTNIQNQITSNANLLNDKIAQKFEVMNNIENIMTEFNELKLLVIKSQNMALETSNSVNKLYEQCNLNSARLKDIETSVSLLHSKKSDATSNIMLQSLLSGSLFKSGDFNAFDFNCQPGDNCANCEPDETYDENIGEIKKLNIDFDSNELVLSEEQIEDLLDIRNPTEHNISIHEIIDDASATITDPDPDPSLETETLATETVATETVATDETTDETDETDETNETEPIIDPVPSEELTEEPTEETEPKE